MVFSGSLQQLQLYEEGMDSLIRPALASEAGRLATDAGVEDLEIRIVEIPDVVIEDS